MKARLLLEDGSVFEGDSLGSSGTVFGEVVFNTGMTGYQEILTDPSYAGQMVTMTYPLIGNYGVNKEDVESDRIQVSGFIVKEAAKVPSHWQCESTLDDYLKANNVVGISGIDTRKLTKIIRNHGTMNGVLTTEPITDQLREDLEAYQFPTDIVAKVSSKEIVTYKGDGVKVALIDLGLKKGIVKQLVSLGCQVRVFPHDVSFEDLKGYDQDVIMFSNGPGDPKDAKAAISLAKSCLGLYPMWGICLGHQILALALDCDTYKLKFGHRGANHPVIDLISGKVYMSSQNHGYAVAKESLNEQVAITHLNVNDETVEGIACQAHRIVSVQFHPEEGPGPEDAHVIFEQWVNQQLGGGHYA